MTLARLDNEVFFKKAFTDPLVFRAFVKDILGIEVDPAVIETEKGFSPKVGSVAFKYDIFAEDSKSRTIVEIQKVDYDHNFFRFLHYHLQAITEQQRSSTDYSIEKTVYTIVVMTAPYKFNEITREPIKDEVLISTLDPRTIKGIERKIFGHELVFLNPNYKSADTPANYRDWLDLIYESIHHPDNPKINENNSGVKRAAEIVSFENITPEEWEESKIEAGRRQVIAIERHEEQRKIAANLLRKNLDAGLVAETTGLSKEEVLEIAEEIAKEK